MRDENTRDEVRCPYCRSVGECSHLLAVIDRTFNECMGGYASQRYDEFRNVIENAFAPLLARGQQTKPSWNDPEIAELWDYALESRPPNNEGISLESYVLDRLIVNCLLRQAQFSILARSMMVAQHQDCPQLSLCCTQ